MKPEPSSRCADWSLLAANKLAAAVKDIRGLPYLTLPPAYQRLSGFYDGALLLPCRWHTRNLTFLLRISRPKCPVLLLGNQCTLQLAMCPQTSAAQQLVL